MDYKKILEDVVNIINTTEKSDIGFANICTYIVENCPELKESEDERIRNFLIKQANSVLESITDDDEEVHAWKSALAWLEKQGEHANFRNKIQIGDKVTRNEDGVLVNLSQLNRVAKSANNIEPKFKVGDWIKHNKANFIFQINKVTANNYEFNNPDGYNHSLSIKSVDKKYHIWTILDAKDGDVLATEPIEGYPSPFVAIYKKQNEEDFDSYCFIGFDGKFYKGENGHSTEEVHPATKEQRDQLEKAMADAGYTFDFEKKKLKKIEQTPNDEIGNYDHGKVLDALMSAKKTPEPAWSEEDVAMLNSAIAFVEHSPFTTIGKGKGGVVAWLKSLKERYTWKPSDEQMDVIEAVINNRSFQRRHLDSLYADLKKLKS